MYGYWRIALYINGARAAEYLGCREEKERSAVSVVVSRELCNPRAWGLHLAPGRGRGTLQ